MPKTDYYVISLKDGWTGSVHANSPKAALQYYKSAATFNLSGNESILVVPKSNAHFYRV